MAAATARCLYHFSYAQLNCMYSIVINYGSVNVRLDTTRVRNYCIICALTSGLWLLFPLFSSITSRSTFDFDVPSSSCNCCVDENNDDLRCELCVNVRANVFVCSNLWNALSLAPLTYCHQSVANISLCVSQSLHFAHRTQSHIDRKKRNRNELNWNEMNTFKRYTFLRFAFIFVFLYRALFQL